MIVLRVKNYCHTCPNFEADTEKLYANSWTCSTTVTCAHAAVCDKIQKHLEKSIDKKEYIKTETTCKTCAYMVCSGSECRKHDFCQDNCPHYDGITDLCKCMQVKTGDPCPHYKLDVKGETDEIQKV